MNVQQAIRLSKLKEKELEGKINKLANNNKATPKKKPFKSSGNSIADRVSQIEWGGWDGVRKKTGEYLKKQEDMDKMREMFPQIKKPEPKPCKCGCGKLVNNLTGFWSNICRVNTEAKELVDQRKYINKVDTDKHGRPLSMDTYNSQLYPSFSEVRSGFKNT